MTESTESLCPDHAEVARTPVIDLGKGAIEDIGKSCHAQASNDGLAASVEAVGDVAERE